jgi:hypothetical protein
MCAGDPVEKSKAGEVISVMKRAGFLLLGNRFVSAFRVLVRSHFDPEGDDYGSLTDGERLRILEQVGVERWSVTSPHLIEQLAYAILDTKQTRGTPTNPLEIQ